MKDENVRKVHDTIRVAYAALQAERPDIAMQEMVAGALAMAASITGLQPEGYRKGLWAVGYLVELLSMNMRTPEELSKLIAEGKLTLANLDDE